MNVIFAGTPDFARVALEALHAAGHHIALVLTQPDRPAGRGLQLQPSAVKRFALQHGLPLCQPPSLRLDGKYPLEAAAAQKALQVALQAPGPAVMVVAAYGLILPQWVLDLPALGCLNIHASLLPRWRGAAPIHRAVQMGDAETGVTIMQMDAGLDTGDMLLMEKTPIQPDDTTGSLHDRLAVMGASLLLRTLELAVNKQLKATKQPDIGITYAQKIDKSEASIHWQLDAAAIVRQVNALSPAPGASTQLRGETFKVWSAQVAMPGGLVAAPRQSTGQVAGQITSLGSPTQPRIEVAAGTGTRLCILQLQRAGGKRLPAAEFLRGSNGKNALAVGDRFTPGGTIAEIDPDVGPEVA